VGYEFPEVPSRMIIMGYNEDDTFDHTFYIRITCLEKEIAFPYRIFEDFVKIIKKLIGV